MKLLFAFTIHLLLLLPSAIGAEPEPNTNWPTWRGPAANGVAPVGATPPLKWDAKTNIKWKVELPGRGSASPIIWGDTVFIVTSIKTDRIAKPAELPKVDPQFRTLTEPPKNFYKFEVLAYDKNTGKLKWQKTANEAVPHEGHHTTHSYAAGSPTTDGNRLYVSFGSFGIYAFDLEGKLLWKRDLGRMNTRLGWGEAVTPVVHGDSLVLNWDQEVNSKLIVLNATTGETRWEMKRDEKTSWNTPVVDEHKKRVQVIINGTTRVRSYDLADGKIIWEIAGMTTNAIPSPLVQDGIAYVMSGYRGASALAVSLDSTGDLKEDGATVWRYKKGTPYVPSPLLYDDKLYFTSTNAEALTILDAKTGTALLSQERIPNAKSFYASPIAANGRIYFVDRSGTTIVLKPGKELEVLATNKLDDPMDACPAVSGKTLFLRGEKYLYAIE